jgi:hypothetical protein
MGIEPTSAGAWDGVPLADRELAGSESLAACGVLPSTQVSTAPENAFPSATARRFTSVTSRSASLMHRSSSPDPSA